MAISLKLSIFNQIQINLNILFFLNKRHMKKQVAFIVGALLFTQGLLAQKPKILKTATDTAAAFDAYVQKSIKEWEIPGLAIVVVKNNKIVFKNSYGTTELGTSNKIGRAHV